MRSSKETGKMKKDGLERLQYLEVPEMKKI